MKRYKVPGMTGYTITIDNHRCRPIEEDDWRDALAEAIQRVYGPRAWSPNATTNMHNGHAYADIYVSPTKQQKQRWGDAASLAASHVEITVEQARAALSPKRVNNAS